MTMEHSNDQGQIVQPGDRSFQQEISALQT